MATLLQAAAPPSALDTFLQSYGGIDRRIDCHVDFFDEMEGRRTPEHGSGDYVFLFLNQPAGATGPGRVLYLLSLSDGRSWMASAREMQRSGDRWPDFSATIDMGWGWSRFTADPAQQGRILYHAEEPHNHDAGFGVTEGSCTLVPQAGGWRPQ